MDSTKHCRALLSRREPLGPNSRWKKSSSVVYLPYIRAIYKYRQPLSNSVIYGTPVNFVHSSAVRGVCMTIVPLHFPSIPHTMDWDWYSCVYIYTYINKYIHAPGVVAAEGIE